MRTIAPGTDLYAETLRALGVQNTDQIGSASPVRPFFMAFDRPAAALAAGATATVQMQVQGAFALAAVAGVARVWLATGGAVGTSIAGTPLIDDADPSPPATVGNIVPADHLITCRLATGDDFYMNQAVPLPFLFGRSFTADRASFYPTPIGFGPRQTISLEVTNGTAQNITFAAGFWCLRLAARNT